MSTVFPDSHPQVEQIQIDLIRRMPPWKKISVVDGLNETIKAMALTGIRERHPEAPPEQIHYLLAEMMLGKELARKVYAYAR